MDPNLSTVARAGYFLQRLNVSVTGSVAGADAGGVGEVMGAGAVLHQIFGTEAGAVPLIKMKTGCRCGCRCGDEMKSWCGCGCGCGL